MASISRAQHIFLAVPLYITWFAVVLCSVSEAKIKLRDLRNEDKGPYLVPGIEKTSMSVKYVAEFKYLY